MKIYGQARLSKFGKRYTNSKAALDAWLEDVEQSEWRTPQDLKQRYPSADVLANNRVIFNIKGNHYRLVAQISYKNFVVLIEWVGTHAQYDKQTFG